MRRGWVTLRGGLESWWLQGKALFVAGKGGIRVPACRSVTRTHRLFIQPNISARNKNRGTHKTEECGEVGGCGEVRRTDSRRAEAGSGALFAIPDTFYRSECKDMGVELPPVGRCAQPRTGHPPPPALPPPPPALPGRTRLPICQMHIPMNG